jgi:hypothetical protein
MATQQLTAPSGNGADSFHRGLADCARRVLRSAQGLTRQQRQLAYDVQRGKYRAGWLVELLGMSARCTEDADRHAIDEHARGFVVMERTHVVPMGVRCPSVAEAGEQETHAQAALDIAQFRYFGDRTLANYEACYDAAVAQMEATRRLIDAMRAEQAARGERRALTLVP